MLDRRIIAASVALAVFGSAFGASTPSNAQTATTLHGVGAVSLAYTDNMFGSPSNPAEGQQGPIGVWMLDLSPGIRVIHESTNALHTLTYYHPFTFYLGHSDATQQSDVGVWAGVFRLSPRDEIILGLSAYRSDMRTVALRGAANQTGVAPQATGKNLMLQANFTQGYSHEFSGQWRLAQRSDFGTILPLLVPTPQPHRYQVLVGGGPEYTTARNAFGLDVAGTYYITTSIDEEGFPPAPSTAQALVEGSFRWRHDLTYTWSTELSVGAAGAVRTDPLRGGVWGPIASAAVRYANEGYESSLTVRRTLGPNLVTATTVFADEVYLGAGMPISREHQVLLRAGAGFSHNRALVVENRAFLAVPPFATPNSSDDARLVTTYNSVGMDASVGWYPDDLPYFEFRFQRTDQFGSSPNQIVPAAAFHRTLAMLTTGFMWPSRDVPPVPAREPGRVDNADRDSRVPGGMPEGAPMVQGSGTDGE